MSAGDGFAIVEDSISESLAISGSQMSSTIAGLLIDEASFVLDYAKATAPWGDRTGAARSGLDVSVDQEGFSVNIDLFHTVDYGLWLEVIQSGRFAVIMPTLEALAPLIFQSVNATYVGYEEGSG